MNLQTRIDLLSRLGEYMQSDDKAWQDAKEKAEYENGWFSPEFIDNAVRNIAIAFLQKEKLEKWTAAYNLPQLNPNPKTVGIVMAGNIPLVGFHDLLSVFISGHIAAVKLSSKDQVLIKHLVETMAGWEEEVNKAIHFAGMLKGCDAYIATGSNNSAGYFDYYFRKYPHIIRRNRTSIAILDGSETVEELEQLADDVFLFFGLGCRNVTKLYVPENYDFIQLINVLKKYDHLADHHKYKNNYDYNLALHLLNKKMFMSSPAILLVEEASLFSPISQLNYEYYGNKEELINSLKEKEELQCIVAKGHIPFGGAQVPGLSDYADGVDTLDFLKRLT